MMTGKIVVVGISAVDVAATKGEVVASSMVEVVAVSIVEVVAGSVVEVVFSRVEVVVSASVDSLGHVGELAQSFESWSPKGLALYRETDF